MYCVLYFALLFPHSIVIRSSTVNVAVHCELFVHFSLVSRGCELGSDVSLSSIRFTTPLTKLLRVYDCVLNWNRRHHSAV